MDLIHAMQLIFNRILDRNYFFIRRINLIKCAVECGCFTATGRPGNKHNAVGAGNQILEIAQIIRRKPQTVKIKGDRFAVENTHDNTLAEQGWQSGNAKIDFLAQHTQFNTAILRQAPLGNVKLGHDFYTGDNGRLQIFGRSFHVMQDTVNTVTDKK